MVIHILICRIRQLLTINERNYIFLKLLLSAVALLFVKTGFAQQIFPDELMHIAEKNDCSQVDDFYKRPGMINPPYVYGYLAGPSENSAAFWCKKAINNKESYLLLFMSKDEKALKCPTSIEWSNYPGGLSILHDPSMKLENFVYINKPSRSGPKNVRLRNNAILSEYDGVSEIFYCYRGEWLVRQRD